MHACTVSEQLLHVPMRPWWISAAGLWSVSAYLDVQHSINGDGDIVLGDGSLPGDLYGGLLERVHVGYAIHLHSQAGWCRGMPAGQQLALSSASLHAVCTAHGRSLHRRL